MVPFDARRNGTELDFQEILGEHPFPALKRYSGVPTYNDTWHWHGSDPILSSVSVGSLVRLGAINVEPRRKIFTVPRYPKVDAALKDVPFDPTDIARYNDTHFHPIFRRKNFPTTDDYDYELLKPVLKVATDLLSSFETLGFFKGLYKAQSFPGTPKEQKRLGKGMLYKFRPETVVSWEDAVDTIRHLRELGEHVTWKFNDELSGAFGALMRTYSLKKKPIFPKEHVSFKPQGLIAMSKRFRNALEPKHRVDELHPEFGQAAADLRTRFYTAVTMIHEVAHAFYMAYSPSQEVIHHEAFMNDGHVAELGYALTKHLFGAAINVIGGNPEHMGVPFGLYFYDWPDSDNKIDKYKARYSLARAGVTTHTYYILPMSHILKILHPQFWNDEALRYGAVSSLRLPKQLGVRYRYDDYKLWLDEHESDMDYEATSPADDLQPDVAEGIITNDTAIPLTLHSEVYTDQLRHIANSTRPWEFVKDMSMRDFPLSWDLIDRFHPDSVGSIEGNIVEPLNALPGFDAVAYRHELRAYIREAKLKKEKARKKRIELRKQKRDKVAKV
ncbi:hypothetical protein E4T49_06774 [Aureobasidium sp. EXF-10728]|nr:hypothetical protein E4T49_06774 [Aureobasidium sp. EXF-10728]